jgi:tetratricopeptide (TPR) repeat protein
VDCLPENVVLELVMGRASPEVRDQAERHLDTCPACRRLVAAMAKVSLIGSPSVAEDDDSPPTVPPEAGGRDPGSPLIRGTAVGRYIILSVIGSGGVGVVYAAYDPELDRKVALKLVRGGSHTQVGGSERRARLLREAQAMARLTHPNVISVYDVGSFEGRVFIAMELVDGCTLTQWLRQARRSWREALQMFIWAGRGLAAAHAAGVVHRDFKPDNVLIRKDGRVRVMDFGLARVAGDPLERTLAVPEATPVDVTAAFTRSGTLMGTPAYMSPEQYDGQPADARTDQFSFCVALHEGLYGVRPFDGKSMDQIRSLATQGIVRAAPANTQVPAWLRRVVLKGLSPKPEDRFASVDALLTALGHDPRAAWRRAAVAGLALLLVAGGATAGRAAFSTAGVCGGSEKRLAGVWDGPRKRDVRAAFERTGGSFAAAAWPKVERAMDAYAAAWVDARADACRATRVRGEQSERLLDVRMECLDRELAQMDQLARLFAGADSEVVARAVSAASELPSLATCATASALDERDPPPRQGRRREKVEEAERAIAEAGALAAAARLRPALEASKRAADAATQSAFAPIRAEAQVELGTLLEKSGDYAAAAKALDEAVWAAEAGRQDEARVRAWTALQRVRRVQGRLDDADEAAGHAQAVLGRLGLREDLDADRLDERGLLRIEQGRLDEALADLTRSQALREKNLAPLHPLRAESLSHLGRVLGLRGADHEALTSYEKALALRREMFPPEHPEVARSLLDVAETQAKLGSVEQALANARRALSMMEASYGADHPSVADAAFVLGEVLQAGKQDAEAEVAYRRAVTSWTVWMGERHRRLITGYSRLAAVAAALGHREEAERDYRRALDLADQLLPAGDPVRLELAQALQKHRP